MSKASAIRESARMLSRHEQEAILAELRQVLASPHFCNSKRYPALLEYVVEATLAGRSDQLKERTIGVEVFARPPAYDTNADTVVRYTAGEVRKRLSLYYSDHGRHPGIRIALPAGSYVPEFLPGSSESDAMPTGGALPSHLPTDFEDPHSAFASLAPGPALESQPVTGRRLYVWLALAAVCAVLLFGLLRGTLYRSTALEQFWSPLLRERRPISLCTGSVVFANNNFSGVITAGKDIDYPFISMQGASAISQISEYLGRGGASTTLQASASTPLPELREHPVILLGGYNNQWTRRLLEPLRFRLAPEAEPAILDAARPGVLWARDQTQSYATADDYAVIARFRDPTTDDWVLVLAGLGRNGTEAAAQFVTSPHYMQLLRDRIGPAPLDRNLEVVLKVRVIEGKTGAPFILAVHSW